MAVVTAATVELTDELAETFLEALEDLGREKLAARAVGIDRRLVWKREQRDAEFRRAVLTIKARRLHAASDDLLMSIDALAATGHSHEHALDELLNCRFGPDELALRPGVDPELLRAARERLWQAATTWAAAVVAHEGISVCDRVKVLDPAPENLELTLVAA